MSTDTCWVDVEILRESPTGLAWLVRSSVDDSEQWIPKRAIADSEDDLEPGVHTKIELPTVLAEEKGLV